MLFVNFTQEGGKGSDLIPEKRRISLTMTDVYISWAVPFVAVYFLFLAGPGCDADCPPTNPNDPNVRNYISINETTYDRNFSEIGSGRHPLGFYSSTWYYNQDDAHNPCIKITAPDASQRWLDIKVETVPESRLCFKDQKSENQCFQGRGTTCRATPGKDIYIEFLCDSQCEEADVNFWYRLVLSPPPSEQDPETWCFNQHAEYPTDLLRPPSGGLLPVFTTPRPKDTGAAPPAPAASFALLAVALFFSYFLS